MEIKKDSDKNLRVVVAKVLEIGWGGWGTVVS